MGINFDSYFGIHSKALLLRDQRSSQLANNLANANTPNYKAKDIDFNETLKQASSTSASAQGLVTSSTGHIPGNSHFSTQLKYRIPNNASLDGNTVDKDMETTEFARNALSYQASLTFLDGKIKSMMTVLRGE